MPTERTIRPALGGVAVLVALAMVMSASDASAISPRAEGLGGASTRQVSTDQRPVRESAARAQQLASREGRRDRGPVVTEASTAPCVGALSLRGRLVRLSDVTLPPPARVL